jgi:phosphate transport system substrate-binding protein
MRRTDRISYQAICHAIREDGAFVEAGENDVLIVQKLIANPNAYGIFGFSFLDQNLDKIQGNLVNGILPEFETISEGSYPISRSMYFYIKNAHADVIPGVADYVAEFTSEKAWGPDGYLADKGLIPLSDEERARSRTDAMGLLPLAM